MMRKQTVTISFSFRTTIITPEKHLRSVNSHLCTLFFMGILNNPLNELDCILLDGSIGIDFYSCVIIYNLNK